MLARLIVDLARFMTLADIAGWLSLSWDTVRTVVQRRLERDHQRIGYRKVHSIAIDELYGMRCLRRSHHSPWDLDGGFIQRQGIKHSVGARIRLHPEPTSPVAMLYVLFH